MKRISNPAAPSRARQAWLLKSTLMMILAAMLLSLVGAAASASCELVGNVQGHVDCAGLGQNLSVQSAGCSPVSWTLDANGDFSAKVIHGTSTQENLTFYLDGSPIGTAAVYFISSPIAPRPQSVNLSACVRTTTAGVTAWTLAPSATTATTTTTAGAAPALASTVAIIAAAWWSARRGESH